MSAAPQHDDGGYVGLRMSASEFLAIGETREKLELVDGVVRVGMRPTPRERMALRLVLRQLESYVCECPGVEFFPNVDVEFGPRTVYAPDIVCYAPGRLKGLPARLSVVPDLIIEILSPGTKAFDLSTKRTDYERAGVREYWAIDPVDASVRVFILRGGAYQEVGAEDHVDSLALPGLRLDLAPLRGLREPGD